MSKLVKFFAIAALLVGAFAMTPGPAAAQHYHGGGHWHGGGGHWHGGGWGWGRGFGWGLGWGYPYYYGGPYYPYYYDGGPDCGWVRVRVWRNGHWVIRRAWRCW